MNKRIKDWIDKASYEQLLEKWRNAPVGDQFFQGEEGVYYTQTMKEKRALIGDEAHAAISKSIGFNL